MDSKRHLFPCLSTEMKTISSGECVLTARKRNEVWGKVIFLHLSVILFTGGGSTWAGTSSLSRYIPQGRYIPWAGTPPTGTPPGRYTPWACTPPRQVHPPGQVHPHRYTPGQVHPPAGTPPGQVHPPRQVHPPSLPIRGSMCGRYASYWNAFLLSDVS